MRSNSRSWDGVSSGIAARVGVITIENRHVQLRGGLSTSWIGERHHIFCRKAPSDVLFGLLFPGSGRASLEYTAVIGVEIGRPTSAMIHLAGLEARNVHAPLGSAAATSGGRNSGPMG